MSRKPALQWIEAILVSLVFVIAPASAPGQGNAESADTTFETTELDKVTVQGQGKQAALCTIRIAAGEHALAISPRPDQVRCWTDDMRGTRLKYLFCGTAGASSDQRCNSRAAIQHVGKRLGHDNASASPARAPNRAIKNVFVSNFPVSEGRIDSLSESMGPGSVDWRIIRHSKALSSAPMPDGAPDEEEMDRFLDAYVKVREIREEYDPRIRKLDGDERASLQSEADSRMVNAIREAGLTMNDYNRIAEMSANNAGVKARLRERLADR